jgi:hypothetical protein
MDTWYYFSRPSNLSSHNITSRYKPPHSFRLLLGLGLNFCPSSNFTTNRFIVKKTCDRLRNDLYKKVIDAGRYEYTDDYNPKLTLARNRIINEGQIPSNIVKRMNAFEKHLKKLFVKKKCRSNLTECQRQTLFDLAHSTTLTICKSDKNLGPVIMDRDDYIKFVFRDHLSDTKTYKQLTVQQAQTALQQVEKKIVTWVKTYAKDLTAKERRFLTATCNAQDVKGNYRYSQFYILVKMHKFPPSSRPVSSCSGSATEKLGVWADSMLQPISKATNCHIKSSTELLEKLKQLPDLPPTARLFTCDAVSMYTNIDTAHALKVLKDMIPEHVLAALQIIMENNIIEFGDTYWRQEDGTAMGPLRHLVGLPFTSPLTRTRCNKCFGPSSSYSFDILMMDLVHGTGQELPSALLIGISSKN